MAASGREGNNDVRKILVGFDGGGPGERALRLAAELAHAFDARVDVVSVVPEGFGRTGAESGGPAIAHARSLVAARDLLHSHGIEAGLIEPAGDPATVIERLVDERGYDAVIVGSSRLVGVGVPWTDTVSAHVAGNAAATVIVAH
jgi:nucleotide-binding universal stress UspA family protein